MDQFHNQVLIIGGGLAGISAACRLVEKGFSVSLLEARPFLGGRAGSFPRGDQELNFGQHLHVRAFTEYINLLQELDLGEEIFTQSRLKASFFDSSGDRGTITASSFPPPLHLAPSLFRYPFLPVTDRLRSVLPPLAGLISENFQEQTFGRWLKNHGATTRSVRRLWNPVIVPTLNAPASEVTVQMGLMILRKVLLDKRGGRLGYLTSPMGTIGDAARRYLTDRDAEVSTGTKVRQILGDRGTVTGVITDDGRELTAEAVISAVPSHRLPDLLPGTISNQDFFIRLGKLDWNPIVNLHLFYDEPVLNQTFVGGIDTDLQWIFDVSRMHSTASNHVCVSLSHAVSEIRKTGDRLLSLIQGELSDIFPAAERTELRDYVVVKQPKATVVPSPVNQQRRPGSNTPVDGFFLAGDWTDTGWPSTMEGAVRSGRKASGLVTNYLQ